MPGTHAQKVILVALLFAQLAPASTVTDELALGEAAALDEAPAAGAELLLPPPPLLHAARPVTAASAAMPPRAS
jgi:hypothetical protein